MSHFLVTEKLAAAQGFEQITVSNAAGGIGLTTAKLTRSNGNLQRAAFKVFLSVETDAIRFTLDGTAPTATVGHKLADGDSITIEGVTNLQNLRMFKVTNDATVSVSYFYN